MPEAALSNDLHGIHWVMSLGKLVASQVLADGPSDSINHLLDHLHLNSALAEQGMDYCTVIARETGSEHYHTHDGCHLSCLLRLLRFYQYRGHETIHFGSTECPVSDPNGDRLEELARDTQLAEGSAALHLRERHRAVEGLHRLENGHHD